MTARMLALTMRYAGWNCLDAANALLRQGRLPREGYVDYLSMSIRRRP